MCDHCDIDHYHSVPLRDTISQRWHCYAASQGTGGMTPRETWAKVSGWHGRYDPACLRHSRHSSVRCDTHRQPLMTVVTLPLVPVWLFSLTVIYNNNTRSMGLCPGLARLGSTRKLKPFWIYWSKRQWVAVASAGLYANLHHAPDG